MPGAIQEPCSRIAHRPGAGRPAIVQQPAAGEQSAHPAALRSLAWPQRPLRAVHIRTEQLRAAWPEMTARRRKCPPVFHSRCLPARARRRGEFPAESPRLPRPRWDVLLFYSPNGRYGRHHAGPVEAGRELEHAVILLAHGQASATELLRNTRS